MTIPTTHSAHQTAFPALDAKAIATHFWDRMTTAQKCTALQLDPAENPVLYLVLHIPTIRKQTPVDTMTDHDPRTAEAVTESALNQIDVIALAERAKLSEQARTAIKALTTPEAVTLAKTARQTALDRGQIALDKLQADRAKAGKKPYNPGKVRQMRKQYEQTAENAYSTALWEYALTKAGYSQTAQAKAKSVIIGKLKEAQRTAPDAMTPGTIDYERIMKQTHRGNPTATGKPIDLIQWTDRHTADHTPVVKWTDSGHTAESMTPGIDYRTADILSRDQYRQTAPKATPPERTPKEQRNWERLCKRDSELAELWRKFDSVYNALEPIKQQA